MKKINNITTTSSALEKELKKSELVYTILYTSLLCVLAIMLIFNYFAVFTSYFYPTNTKGQYMVGVVKIDDYHQTEEGQLLLIEKYQSISQIAVGDELFFAGNGGEGSGIVKKVYSSQDYVSIIVNNQTKNVAINTIIGKVVQKNNGWGYVVWFFQSWTGTIVLNLALIALVLLRTFLGFTTESSAKGRELKRKLLQQKHESKKFKKNYKNYTKTGLDIETFELLSGDFEENKQKILDFAKQKDIANTYKFLLQKVHRVYISKHKINELDRKKITNCVELMCLAENFDIDCEYMLTDLILKTNVVNFDIEKFLISAKIYLHKTHTIEDYESFLTVLYVLIKKNKHLQKYEMFKFCEDMEISLRKQSDISVYTHLFNLCDYIKKLI